MTARNKQLATAQPLTWNHETQLSGITGGGLPTESYLYDPDGARIRKTSSGVNTWYVNGFYEVTGSTATKYYYFGSQRVAMKVGTTLTYLHTDHLGSTVLETNTSGAVTADQAYRAYGKQRDAGAVVTEHKFTGQKLDASGLQYFAP